MLVFAITSAATSVVIAICWLIANWRTSGVVERTTELAIKDCPPERRAAILRASAELAGRLRSERSPATTADALLRLLGKSLPGK